MSIDRLQLFRDMGYTLNWFGQYYFSNKMVVEIDVPVSVSLGPDFSSQERRSDSESDLPRDCFDPPSADKASDSE